MEQSPIMNVCFSNDTSIVANYTIGSSSMQSIVRNVCNFALVIIFPYISFLIDVSPNTINRKQSYKTVQNIYLLILIYTILSQYLKTIKFIRSLLVKTIFNNRIADIAKVYVYNTRSVSKSNKLIITI